MEKPPPNIEALKNRASAHATRGTSIRKDELNSLYSCVLSRSLEHAPKSLVVLGDIAAALATCEEAITLSPTDATLYANRSALQLKLGKVDAALADAEKVSHTSLSVVAHTHRCSACGPSGRVVTNARASYYCILTRLQRLCSGSRGVLHLIPLMRRCSELWCRRARGATASMFRSLSCVARTLGTNSAQTR